LAKAEKKFGEQIKTSTNELAALIKSQRSASGPNISIGRGSIQHHTLQLLTASPVGHTPSPAVGGKVEVNKYLQDLVNDAKACED
jgi:hypothetical protein